MDRPQHDRRTRTNSPYIRNSLHPPLQHSNRKGLNGAMQVRGQLMALGPDGPVGSDCGLPAPGDSRGDSVLVSPARPGGPLQAASRVAGLRAACQDDAHAPHGFNACRLGQTGVPCVFCPCMQVHRQHLPAKAQYPPPPSRAACRVVRRAAHKPYMQFRSRTWHAPLLIDRSEHGWIACVQHPASGLAC